MAGYCLTWACCWVLLLSYDASARNLKQTTAATETSPQPPWTKTAAYYYITALVPNKKHPDLPIRVMLASEPNGVMVVRASEVPGNRHELGLEDTTGGKNYDMQWLPVPAEDIYANLYLVDNAPAPFKNEVVGERMLLAVPGKTPTLQLGKSEPIISIHNMLFHLQQDPVLGDVKACQNGYGHEYSISLHPQFDCHTERELKENPGALCWLQVKPTGDRDKPGVLEVSTTARDATRFCFEEVAKFTETLSLIGRTRAPNRSIAHILAKTTTCQTHQRCCSGIRYPRKAQGAVLAVLMYHPSSSSPSGRC